MMTYEEQVKIDTILDLSGDIIKTINTHLQAHGPDPELNALLSASLVMVIQDLNKVMPIEHIISEMLLKKAKKK